MSSEKFMHGIRVLMAKNYIDNLSEEVRKGMREKAEQGHGPTVAHVGYLNNSETRRIEIDPVRGPLVAQVFEWYARGGRLPQVELASIRRETARHEKASHDYGATGSKLLELAKNAHNLFVLQDPHEQARLLKMLVSNCTFDRGSLSVAYIKPFDLLVDGNESGNWLGGRDSNHTVSEKHGWESMDNEGHCR